MSPPVPPAQARLLRGDGGPGQLVAQGQAWGHHGGARLWWVGVGGGGRQFVLACALAKADGDGGVRPACLPPHQIHLPPALLPLLPVNTAQVKEVHAWEDWGLCHNGTRNEGAVRGAVDEWALSQNLVLTGVQRGRPRARARVWVCARVWHALVRALLDVRPCTQRRSLCVHPVSSACMHPPCRLQWPSSRTATPGRAGWCASPPQAAMPRRPPLPTTCFEATRLDTSPVALLSIPQLAAHTQRSCNACSSSHLRTSRGWGG